MRVKDRQDRQVVKMLFFASIFKNNNRSKSMAKNLTDEDFKEMGKSKSAFPYQTEYSLHSGINLREYFAAKAMQSLIHTDRDMDDNFISRRAFMYADAMVKEGRK